MKLHKKSTWLFILVWAVAFGISLIALNDAFLSDEFEYIAAAAKITSADDLLDTLSTHIGGEFYRPILHISFFIDYWIYGLQSWGYHLTNSILHATNSLLLTLVVWRFGRKYYPQDKERRNPLLFIAIISGLFFSILPNHHEAVTWLAGRTDLLSTTFYLLTVCMWLYYLRRISSSGLQTITVQEAMKRFLMLLSIACISALAYFSKEMAITLVVTILCITIWHYIRLKKINDVGNKITGLLLAYTPLLVVASFYIVIRKYIVGFWLGGYVLSGSSEFVSVNFESIKNFLLVPKNILFYGINHSYAYHVLSVKIPGIASSLTYSQYISLFNWVVYILIVLALILIASRVKKGIVSFSHVAGIGIPLLVLVYIIAAPAIGVLDTINLALESTRYFYLPSLIICILLALTLSLLEKKPRSIVTSVILATLCIGYFFNYLPWSRADAAASSVQEQFSQQSSELSENDWIFVVNVPDNIFGAYVYRRGLTQSLHLLNSTVSEDHIIISGRGVAGTFAPQCISALNDSMWRMQLDKDTGVVTSFLQKDYSDEHASSILVSDYEFTTHDIQPLGNGNYVISGDQPYIQTTNLQMDPTTVSSLVMYITLENEYWAPFHVYWKTAENPSYHEYHRHIQKYIGISPGNGDPQGIIIDVCRYPSFVFSDEISEIKIILPFNIGEYFSIE